MALIIKLHRNYCEHKTMLFAEVDGGWGFWGDWSDCTKTCEAGESIRSRLNRGKSRRTRLCDQPLHEYGGATCLGNATSFVRLLNNGTIQQEETKDCYVHDTGRNNIDLKQR